MLSNKFIFTAFLSLLSLSGIAYSKKSDSTNQQLREVVQYEKLQYENFSKYGATQQFEGCLYHKGTALNYEQPEIYNYKNFIDAVKNKKISCMIFKDGAAFGKTSDDKMFQLHLKKDHPDLFEQLIKHNVNIKSVPPNWRKTYDLNN